MYNMMPKSIRSFIIMGALSGAIGVYVWGLLNFSTATIILSVVSFFLSIWALIYVLMED